MAGEKIVTDHRVVGIHPIYRSGSVTRWHANPDVPAQTLADHQGRVAQIIFFFWPKSSANLIYEALHHDCGEMIVGDVPRPIKKQNTALEFVVSKEERQARAKMGIAAFRDKDPRLRFADHLEAYTYVALRNPHILTNPDWILALHELGLAAAKLNIEDRLAEWWRR